MPSRALAIALSAVALTVPIGSAPGVDAAPRPPAAVAPSIVWTPCHELLGDWDPADRSTECGTVTVPISYDDPDGRSIDLMVSRLRATDPERRRGVLLINPGGPGNSGLDMPAAVSASTLGDLAVDHDLIGFDPRGVRHSGSKECDHPADPPDPAASPEQRFRHTYAATARRHAACVGHDPAFVAGLSTITIARDMDAIRVALGEERINFYGISWGTALGAVYRSHYDHRVDRMLLDSLMPADFTMQEFNDGPVRAFEANFDRFTRWVAERDGQYRLGDTAPEVVAAVLELNRRLDAAPVTVTPPAGEDGTAEPNTGEPVEISGRNLRQILAYEQYSWPDMAASIAALRAGEVPPLLGNTTVPGTAGLRDSLEGGIFMQFATVCNDSGADPDVDTLWREQQRREVESPLFIERGKYFQPCAGWPLPVQPWSLAEGDSALQLVGHRHETVTPYVWAVAMQERLGGSLLTVEDDIHGSLNVTSCGRRAVEFLRSGQTDDGTCVPTS